MAFFRGLDGVLKVGNPAVEVAEVQSWSLESSASIEAAWAMGDTAQRKFVSAPPDSSGSFEVYLDTDDPGQAEAIKLGQTLDFEFYPGGEATDTGYFAFSAVISSVERSGSKTEIPTLTVGFEVNGGVTSATVS